MSTALLDLVGREEELRELVGGLDELRAGRGRVWLIAGEPGIGKSRLAEAVAEEATHGGLPVLWGRCWEAGGAPAYWPWIQVLRAALGEPGAPRPPLPSSAAAHLVQLLPELREHYPELPDPPPIGAEQARFQLLDAAAATLCGFARERPALVVLEDLHVADPSSLVLLEFLASQIRGAPLAVLGTYRDAEAQAGAAGAQLTRIARAARTLTLARFGRAEVEQLLARAIDESVARRLADPLQRRTEGLPLFLVESVRLMQQAAGADPDSTAVQAAARTALGMPQRVRAILEDRIASLSREAHSALTRAAVVGREFASETLAALPGLEPPALADALAEAVEAAVLSPVDSGRYRFAHILYREVLHDELDPDARADMHRQLATLLERRRAEGREVPWSVIAHHYAHGGEPGRARAVEASVCAAESALEQAGFDEAIDAYRRALELAAGAPAPDPRRRAELRLGLAHAQLHAGRREEGRVTALEVIDQARELDDPGLLARAALELGAVYVFAVVDPTLVALLAEALERLDAGDSSLRARVMGRLAAARQPAPDPAEPIALAADAVAMARRIGDPHTLLDALQAAGSCMMDLSDAGERVEIDREYTALAESLGRELDVLRGATRVAVDRFELGDVAGARRAIERVERASARLDHPFFAWRAEAFAATLALWEGRLEEAAAHIERVRDLGERGGDANARTVHLFQSVRLADLAGDRDAVVIGARTLAGCFEGTPVGDAVSGLWMCAHLVRAGCVDEARRALGERWARDLLRTGDRTMLESIAEVAAATEDRALAEEVRGRVAKLPGRLFTSGVVGLTWDGSLARVHALACRTLGLRDEAARLLADAIAELRAAGGPPLVARTGVELAELLMERAAASDLARATELLDESDEIAERIGMKGLRERIGELRSRRGEAVSVAHETAVAVPRVESLRMEREGDTWALCCGERTVRLKDQKGLRLLAVLVAEPGREFHVLDLEQGPAGATVDTGDAGEHLDPQAVRAYRARAEELRGELAEAEQWNDVGRAERARAELEAITTELSRGVGLGGRERRAGAAAERARVNVQRRIKAAVKRIAELDPELGRHLEWAVRTGSFCSYEP